MKVSFQERRRNRGWGAQGKGKLRNYVQDHCAQGVLKLLKHMAGTVNSQEAKGAYFHLLSSPIAISFKAGKTNVTVKSP